LKFLEALMFTRTADVSSPKATVSVDGNEIEAREGDTVAAAMLAAGIVQFRTTPVSGAPRGPLCMMGACFECLVTIDGIGSRQACLTVVRPGMTIETQRGRRELR
jgi:predicted molibdopterin-dependent oxidoreductase YjgC